MHMEQANAIATALDGDSWQSGGGMNLVLIHRKDGRLVVISDEFICEYESEEAFYQCRADKSILLV